MGSDNYVIITFKYAETGISEVYEIDLESGIVKNAYSYRNGNVYYAMQTSELKTNNLTFTSGFFDLNSVRN